MKGIPRTPEGGGLLSDRERFTRLIDCGLPIADTADREAAEERFYAYMALSAPSRRLVVSYLTGDASGQRLMPSSLVETVTGVLPHCRLALSAGRASEEAETEAEAFEAAAALWRKETTEAPRCGPLFESGGSETGRSGFSSRYRVLERAGMTDRRPFIPRKWRGVFWQRDAALPSRVEAYHLCRYAYFCRYGLWAKARRPADLDALEFGTLAHYDGADGSRLCAGGFRRVDRNRVEADAHAAIDRYVEERMGGAEDKSNRFRYLLTRLHRICAALLWQVVRSCARAAFAPWITS